MLAPINEVELLMFVLDGSDSMNRPIRGNTKKTRSEKQAEIANKLIERLSGDAHGPRYRIGVIYFAKVSKNGLSSNYTTLDKVKIKNATDEIKLGEGGETLISKALKEAKSIIDDFLGNKSLPKDKFVDIFLFTDGAETGNSKDVEEIAEKIKKHPLCEISLITISFGEDTDEDLLEEIASAPLPRQLSKLDKKGLLSKSNNILKNQNKLFLIGHEDGTITKQKVEALRNFIYILSSTAKKS